MHVHDCGNEADHVYAFALCAVYVVALKSYPHAAANSNNNKQHRSTILFQLYSWTPPIAIYTLFQKAQSLLSVRDTDTPLIRRCSNRLVKKCALLISAGI
jgi:hypothetical protein